MLRRPAPTWKDWQELDWLLERDSVLWIRFCSTRKWMSSTLKHSKYQGCRRLLADSSTPERVSAHTRNT